MQALINEQSTKIEKEGNYAEELILNPETLFSVDVREVQSIAVQNDKSEFKD